MSNSILKISFIIAILCSVISQFPTVLRTPAYEFLKIAWILPLICCLLKPKSLFPRELMPFYSFLILFFLYCAILENLTFYKYIGIDLWNICISLLVCAVSYSIWSQVGSQKFFNQIALLLLFVTAIFGYEIYSVALSVSSIHELQYAYSSKNSAGQIILNALILLMGIRGIKKWQLTAAIFVSVLLLVEIFVLKSRATMVGVMFVIFYLIIKAKDKRVKAGMRFLLLISIIYIIYDCLHENVIMESIFFANRDVTDINNLSSNRLFLITRIWQRYLASPFIGLGNHYIDCFPIAVITQYGVVSLLLFIPFFIWLFRLIIFKIRRTKPLYLVTFLLFCAIMLNSLFEAQPPFGPGMKCFMVWMTIGFSLAELNKTCVDKNIRFSLKRY